MHRSKRILDTQHERLFVSSVVYQTVRVSGVGRRPLMFWHSMGTWHTFVQTSAQSAAAFRGSGGCFYRILQPPRLVLMLYCKLLNGKLANGECIASDLQSTTILSVPINRLRTCTGGARPLVARARAPVCLSLATPLMRIMLCFFTVRCSFHC